MLSLVAVAAFAAIFLLAMPANSGAQTAQGGLASEIFSFGNQERQARGLVALQYDQNLASVAQQWAMSMAQSGVLQHRSDLFGAYGSGYDSVAENIAWNTASSGAIHYSFMTSSAHRQNLLDAAYDVVGVGVACTSDGVMWVAVNFGQLSSGPHRSHSALPPQDPIVVSSSSGTRCSGVAQSSTQPTTAATTRATTAATTRATSAATTQATNAPSTTRNSSTRATTTQKGSSVASSTVVKSPSVSSSASNSPNGKRETSGQSTSSESSGSSSDSSHLGLVGSSIASISDSGLAVGGSESQLASQGTSPSGARNQKSQTMGLVVAAVALGAMAAALVLPRAAGRYHHGRHARR